MERQTPDELREKIRQTNSVSAFKYFLRELRVACGFPLPSDLARAAKVHSNYIHQVESETYVDFPGLSENLLPVILALGLTAKDLPPSIREFDRTRNLSDERGEPEALPTPSDLADHWRDAMKGAQDIKEFGINFKNLRIACGFPSQAALASEAKVVRHLVNFIERGNEKKFPSMNTLAKLISLLGFDKKYLPKCVVLSAQRGKSDTAGGGLGCCLGYGFA